jgi:hypothetical protein
VRSAPKKACHPKRITFDYFTDYDCVRIKLSPLPQIASSQDHPSQVLASFEKGGIRDDSTNTNEGGGVSIDAAVIVIDEGETDRGWLGNS